MKLKKYDKVIVITGKDKGKTGTIVRVLPREGKILVTGQDADVSACQRIMRGTQTMTIYKPLKTLATFAAEVAVDIAKGGRVPQSTTLNNGFKEVPSVFKDIFAVDKENMQSTVIADGFHPAASLK